MGASCDPVVDPFAAGATACVDDCCPPAPEFVSPTRSGCAESNGLEKPENAFSGR
jgi:hypothetical protein